MLIRRKITSELLSNTPLNLSGERMCTILVNCLEDYTCQINVWLGKLTVLDMTHWVDWAIKPQHKQNSDKLAGRMMDYPVFLILENLMS